MFGKMWKACMAQVNKLANFFWQADPIAQMQLEYDNAVEQLKEGRKGLEQYRALVERVGRQVRNDEAQIQTLTSRIKAYRKSGEREMAGKFAIDLKRAQADMAENSEQLKLHEQSYNNNVKKIKAATAKLADVRTKIQKYDAELKMSEAEAEVSQLAQNFNFDVTTDFGELENVIQSKIDLNHAKVRVASDLSGEGVAEIEAEERMQKAMAEDLLCQFEADMGIKTPETANIEAQTKAIGGQQMAGPTPQEKEAALDEFEKQIDGETAR